MLLCLSGGTLTNAFGPLTGVQHDFALQILDSATLTRAACSFGRRSGLSLLGGVRSGGWRASLVLQCKACLPVVRADWPAARPGGVFWLVGDVQGRVKDSPSVHLRVNISSVED